jgi:hypothetical protein
LSSAIWKNKQKRKKKRKMDNTTSFIRSFSFFFYYFRVSLNSDRTWNRKRKIRLLLLVLTLFQCLHQWKNNTTLYFPSSSFFLLHCRRQFSLSTIQYVLIVTIIWRKKNTHTNEFVITFIYFKYFFQEIKVNRSFLPQQSFLHNIQCYRKEYH